MSEPLTLETFEEWKHHPVTKRLMKQLRSDRETMKEGLINNAFEEEQEVKGRCRAIAVILDIDYYDLVEQVK
jgi:uncharacterized phage-associated protein